MFLYQTTEPPDTYLDLVALLTSPAAAVLAVTVIVSGLAYVLNRNPRWLGLVVSIVVVFGANLLSGKNTPADLFMAFINSFVVFFSAAGLSSAVALGLQPKPTTLTTATSSTTGLESASEGRGAGTRRTFFQRWF